MNNSEKNFYKKYFTHYFAYGYLSLAAVVLFFVSAFICYRYLPMFRLFMTIWSFLASTGFLILFFKIAFTTKHKFKFYRVSLKVLEREGANKNFFEPYMDKLCYRIIIKDLFAEFGMIEEYKKLALG